MAADLHSTGGKTPIHEPDSYPGAPRWVRAFGIVTLVIAVLFVALHLTGHGPGEHLHSHHDRQPTAEGRQP